jgi:hypothetical protein
LFSVNATTAGLVPRLFARNERVACGFATPAGSMAMVLVGAIFVGGSRPSGPARSPRSRLPPGFTQIHEATDIGLLMDGPLGTRWSDSLIRYADFEAEYDRRLEREIALLRRAAPDLVLADVPWLPLDAARRAGIPAVALCSLNWYDILLESPVADQVPAP